MKRIDSIDLAAVHAELSAPLAEAFERVMASGRYVGGPEVEGFEREFAAFCGVGGAVGVNSGLDAVRLALEGLGVGPGDEVIVPAHTAVPTWLAVSAAGCRPVPVDPDQSTMLVDGAGIARAVGPRTAAVVVVHLYGLVVEMDPIAELARRHGLALVEDASQAHGARWHGRRIGALADAAAFSLYPTKNLGAAGDAGIVTSDDERMLERVRRLASYGSRTPGVAESRGVNSRLDALQAAILRVKLADLDRANDQRRVHAERYRVALSGRADVKLPRPLPGSEPVWHQYVVRVRQRDRVGAELARRGVQTAVHYPVPPHRMPAYADLDAGPLPLAERLAEEVLSLPVAPHVTERGCGRVCAALENVLEQIPPR